MKKTRLSQVMVVVEAFIALYFLWDSIDLVYQWNVQHETIPPKLIEVAINMMAYLYLIMD